MDLSNAFDVNALAQPQGQAPADPQAQEPINTFDGFDDLLNNINAGTEPPAPTPTPEDAPPLEDIPEKPTDDVEDLTDLTDLPHNKQNAVFAQMRIQNRQQNMVLRNILQKAGLDQSLADDPQKVLELLDNAEAEQQAEQLQVPAELLQRLNYLERQNRATESERAYQNAMNGFQEIQNTYQLNQQQLQAFAQQLQQVGIDPFAQQVDLMREFRNINYNWIIARERQIAMQEAIAAQQKAAQFSTTPTRTTGKPPLTPTGDKIDTMAKLDRMLLDLSK